MTAPAIPRNVVAQQADSRILITWDLVGGATNYNLQRSTDNISYSTIASPTVPEHEDTGLTNGTRYYYRVNSDDGVDESSYSDVVSETPVPEGQATLGQIREAAKEKADMVSSKFIPDKEWNGYINQSYYELYDILIQKFGDDYFVAPALTVSISGNALTLPNGTNHSAAPAFYKLLGVDLQLNAGNEAYVTLRKFNFIDRNRYVYPTLGASAVASVRPQYRIVGNEIQFIPRPTNANAARLWYIPRLSKLLKDTDIADGVSGWTEYIAVDAALKALAKEESDVGVLAAQKVALIARIESAAENRDAGQPDTVSDVRSSGSFYGGDGFDGPIGGV